LSIEITTLPNGLRIVTETMPHVESVSCGIWIGTMNPPRSAAFRTCSNT